MILGRIGYLIHASKHLLVSRKLMGSIFVIFLVFANGTGVELFLNSSRSMNATITVFLFLYIGYLEYGLSEARSRIPAANASNSDVLGRKS